MNKVFLTLFLTFALSLSAAERDGSIVSQEPCAAVPDVTYDFYLEDAKKREAAEVEAAKREGFEQKTPPVYLTRDQFERRNVESTRIDCRRLQYMSDGLKVVAYTWSPKNVAGQKLPLIIFNRGGNSNLGKLTPATWVRRFVLDGFVVLASQYRGADGGEGKDEFGGADVHDVLNLLPVAQSLGNADMNNVFLLGWSRGGMMTALALREGIKVNAAAVGAPVTDLVREAARRPGLAEHVWKQSMPGYGEDALRARSAVHWADRIKTPLLILQGTADWRAEPSGSLKLAEALQRSGATYELVMYAGDDHALSINKDESNRRIVQWFRKHMAPVAPNAGPANAGPASAGPPPLPSITLPPDLDRILRDYEKAWRAYDAPGLARLFTEDGFVLSSGKHPVRGRAAIQEAYAGQGGPLVLRALAYSTDGAAGYIIGAYKTSEEAPDMGKFTLSIRRGTDGRWMIAGDMDNTNSSPRRPQ